jgi:hypothetical protein
MPGQRDEAIQKLVAEWLRWAHADLTVASLRSVQRECGRAERLSSRLIHPVVEALPHLLDGPAVVRVDAFGSDITIQQAKGYRDRLPDGLPLGGRLLIRVRGVTA